MTDAQIAAYRQEGVVFPLTAFDSAQAAAYAADLRRDCGQAERPVSDAGIRQPSTRVKSYLLFPWAAALIRTPAILDAVAQVIGPDIMAFHSTVWMKPAGTSTKMGVCFARLGAAARRWSEPTRIRDSSGSIPRRAAARCSGWMPSNSADSQLSFRARATGRLRRRRDLSRDNIWRRL